MLHEHAPQLLLDLSELLRHDARSGVQRVTRGILQALLSEPPAGYHVCPVYALDGYYAYAVSQPGTDGGIHYSRADAAAAQPIRVQRGDLFLGLDLALEDVVKQQQVLASLQTHGVQLYFFVYDILPLLHPEWFHAGLVQVFADWLAAIATLADGLICISRATADDLCAWLEQNTPHRSRPLQLGYAHLGADLTATTPSKGIEVKHQELLQQLAGQPTFLMVGTLEPRKMQAQALDAFEQLWRSGTTVNLVIVGKPGWLVDSLLIRLQQHPQQGRQLFWMEHCSDELLEQLYHRSTALLAASLAEGFGLPLIEAAHHQLPVLARDLPVFREIAQDHAWYFTASNGQQLSQAIRQWLELYANDLAPQSGAMTWLTWSDSARQLLKCILDQRWYCRAPTLLP